MARTARKARVRNCWMIRTSGICTWGGESYMSQVNAETLTEGSEEQAAVVPVEGGWLHSRQAMGIGLIIILVAMWVMGYASGAGSERMLSLTIWGVMLSGIIALGGIGLTLCYGVLKFPNFAHGELVTMGAYVTFAVIQVIHQADPVWLFSFGWELMVGLVAAVIVTGIVAIIVDRSEEHTSELQSLMRISYAVFCLKK